MEINRKRVAKRLASGLVAGALALGGLALTGASPAGAANPDWSVLDSRIGGADRYETAVLVAEDRGWSNLIIASGENPADALAASAIVEAEDAAILLTMSDGLPEIVADYLDENDDFAGDVYIVGGESAISADVEDAIGDLMPDATVTRVAGDNRYETAAEINALLGVPDGAIIVNGADGRWPDALSVGQVAALLEWPIIVTGDGGLNDVATEQIDNLLLDNDEASFLLIGGTTVMPQSVEDYLLDEGVSAGSIRRLGGADRYGTNVQINAWMLEGAVSGFRTTAEAPLGDLYAFDDGDLAGYGVTLVSGEVPWDALSATAWTVNSEPWHLVLVKRDSLPPFTGVAMGLLAQLGGPQGVQIIGGPNAVSNSVKTALFAAINTDAPAATLGGCAEGSEGLTADFTGLDPVTKGTNGALGLTVTLNDDVVAHSNGDPSDGDIIVTTDVSSLGLYAAGSHWDITFEIYDTDEFVPLLLAADDVIEVDVNENVSGIYQLVDTATCEVTADEDAPTITIDATTEGIHVTASEPVVEGSLSVVDANGDPFAVDSTYSTDIANNAFAGSDYSTSWYIDFDGSVDADTRVYVEAGSFEDRVGNATEEDSSDRVALDSTDPSISKLAAVCTNTASTEWVVAGTAGDLTIIKNNMLAEGSTYAGPEGNEWTVEVVDDRGGDSVTVAADSTEKTLTITADVGRASHAEVFRAFVDAGLGGLLGSWTVQSGNWDSLLDDDGEIDIDSEGTRDCTVVMSHSEPSTVSWSDSDLDGDDVFGGLNGMVSGKMSILVFTGLEDASSEIEINLDAAPEDLSGNNSGATRLTFTI